MSLKKMTEYVAELFEQINEGGHSLFIQGTLITWENIDKATVEECSPEYPIINENLELKK